MKKKILCGAVTIAMILSGLGAFPTYAEQAVSQSVASSYEDVLSKVKQKITVSDEMTEFDMDISENRKGEKSYYFSWSTNNDGGYTNANLSVTSDADGNIVNYYCYNSDYFKDEGKFKISDMSKNEVRSEIENQLKTLIPEKFDKLQPNGDISVNGNEYNINYYRIENGIKVYDNYVYVSAVLYDGKIILHNMNVGWDDAKFNIPENMINDEKAAELYKEKARFYLNYGTKYNTSDKYDAFLRYSFEKNVFIDAISGERLEKDSYREYGTASAATENAIMDKEDAAFGISPAEQSEIDTIAGLISYKDAEKKMRAIKELELTDSMIAENKSVTKNGEEYIMRITFADKENKKRLYVSINAQNGDLYSFNTYSYDEQEQITLSDIEKNTAADKIADFVQKYISEYYKITSPTKPEASNEIVSVRFERTENNIPVARDGITVQWNAKKDKLVSVYANKTNLADIENPENIIDETAAYDTVLKNCGFEKFYVMNGGEMKIAYCIGDTEKSSIDAVTGDMINNRGDTINVFSGYTDIGGHWCENTINMLADYGIQKFGGVFKPDENITQSEFLSMLYSAQYMYTPTNEKDIYNRFVRQGIIGEDEINPTGSVTKQQAVVYLLKIMGHGDVAQINGIYKCDFHDAETFNEKYFGYIAIAKGMGIVNGDESNNFNPDKDITNSQAATIIYNYLKR